MASLLSLGPARSCLRVALALQRAGMAGLAWGWACKVGAVRFQLGLTPAASTVSPCRPTGLRGGEVCGGGSTLEAFPAAVASSQDCSLCKEAVPEPWCRCHIC